MAKARSHSGNNGANLGLEQKLWAAADKLEATIRKNLRGAGT
jgi:hypothetical protein